MSPLPLKAYVVGTIDTKGEELHYVRDLIAEAGIPTVLVDVGPRSQEPDCDVRSAEVASFHPKSSSAVVVDDRGRAIDAMAQVTDIAGLNRLSRVVLGNAAHALVGMMRRPIKLPEATKSAIGLTMYGVTTPCVRHVTNSLKNQFDWLVFHATGPGGQSMERLIESGFLCGVVDTTTSDIVDLLMGGFFAAGNDRLGAVARTRAPYVGSCGALDMINFRGPETVPIHYRERRLHRHNPFITLVRTTPDENIVVGKWMRRRSLTGPLI